MIFRYTLFALFASVSLFGASNFGAIATGSKTGTYIQIGKDISTVFKKYKAELEVLSTGGSKDNLDALTGKNEFARAKWAIVQSDALDYYNFLHFKATKKDVASTIKPILPLYSEHIHMFIKKGRSINFKKGAKILIGVSSKTSGTAITAKMMENIYDITFGYRYLDYKKGLEQLRKGTIDIYISVNAMPVKKFKNIQGISLLPLPKNSSMDNKYTRTKFTKSDYKWLDKSVVGYKVPSMVVTKLTEKKHNKAVGIFMKIILNNYKGLIKHGHPKWREAYNNRALKLENMHPVAYHLLHR